jgi:multidrug transporter EmrE-like cation transporter
MNNSVSLLFSLFAYSLLSIGLVLMKKGVIWIGWKNGKKGGEFYYYLFIWILGFILTNVSVIPNGIALKVLPPHIVASIAGWGIIIMVLFSYFWLKENLYKSDFIYFTFIIMGIFLLGYFEKVNKSTYIPSKYSLILISVFPLVLLSVMFIKPRDDKLKAVVLSIVAGLSAGLIIIYIKILVNLFGFKVIAYLYSPYLYIYLFFSLAAFIFLQLAYKKGDMLIVGPIYYSLNIVYTTIVTIFFFNIGIEIIQYFAIIMIIVSLIKISSVNRVKIVKNRTL